MDKKGSVLILSHLGAIGFSLFAGIEKFDDFVAALNEDLPFAVFFAFGYMINLGSHVFLLKYLIEVILATFTKMSKDFAMQKGLCKLICPKKSEFKDETNRFNLTLFERKFSAFLKQKVGFCMDFKEKIFLDSFGRMDAEVITYKYE